MKNNAMKIVGRELLKWVVGFAAAGAALGLSLWLYGVGENAGKVKTPVAQNPNGVITADEWEEAFPDQVRTYKANSENTYAVPYLEEDPYLKNLYEGFGFAKPVSYTHLRAHET